MKRTQPTQTGTEIRFVRYGRVPESGSSVNWQTGDIEAGVSVYELHSTGEAIGTVRAEFADRALVYVGRGIVVGAGSDGEPLVRVLSIRKATTGQEERAYYGMSRAEYLKSLS